MDRIETVIEELRQLNEPVPQPMSLPSERDVQALESRLGITFPADYRTYLLKASDVVFGTLEPATVTEPGRHTHLPEVIFSARECGVPESLLPFCEDNGDFYCLSRSGGVVFWSHNGPSNERWPSLAMWIARVWIEEHA